MVKYDETKKQVMVWSIMDNAWVTLAYWRMINGR